MCASARSAKQTINLQYKKMAGKTDLENSLDKIFHGCDLVTEYYYCCYDLFACFYFLFCFVLFFFLLFFWA